MGAVLAQSLHVTLPRAPGGRRSLGVWILSGPQLAPWGYPSLDSVGVRLLPRHRLLSLGKGGPSPRSRAVAFLRLANLGKL